MEVNKMYDYGAGYRAAPRSKRNVPYVAPTNLPDGVFGSLPRARSAALDLPGSMFGNASCGCGQPGCPACGSGLGSFGRLTGGEVLGLAVSTPVIVGVTAATLAVSALVQSELAIYLKGFQRGLTRKQIAKRNAALGAAIGMVGASALGYIAIKS